MPQRPSRALLALAVAATVLLAAGITATVSRGSAPDEDRQRRAEVAPAEPHAPERTAGGPPAAPQALAEPPPSVTPGGPSPPAPPPSVPPGAPTAASVGSAAKGPADRKARPSPPATTTRPPAILRPRAASTAVADPAAKPPAPPAEEPEVDRVPIPEVPF